LSGAVADFAIVVIEKLEVFVDVCRPTDQPKVEGSQHAGVPIFTTNKLRPDLLIS
jgi:hypothetical protein